MQPVLRSCAIGAIVVLIAIVARAACPERAPGSMDLALTPLNTPVSSGGGVACASVACANGPATLRLVPVATSLFCCGSPYDPGYVISPCDTVTWDFGDGTTQTLIGTDRVTHDYAVPGNYTPRATVTNALGSATVVKGYCCSGPGLQPPAEASDSNGAVIATSPSALHFATGNGKSAGVDCSDCIVIREDNGPLTLLVLRTLDLSRSVSTEAVVHVTPPGKSIRVPLLFLPGETAKSFTVPIINDQVWSGTNHRWDLGFVKTTGGTLTAASSVYVLDDDPRPTLSIEPAMTVLEGDYGLTTVTVPYHLSAPMGVTCFVEPLFYPVAAVLQFDSTDIEPGKTSGIAIAKFPANTLPEPDKSFEIRLVPAARGADPLFGVSVCTITILNDDAALLPQQITAASNASARLTLDVGSPYSTPMTAVITSTAPGIASVPESVTIPAGATTVTFVVTPHAEGRAHISAVVPARTTLSATITVTAPARRRAAAH